MKIFKETEKIELKKSTSELKLAIISIVSILNKHNSGKLYFGIKDNGEVIGQEIGKNTLRDIASAISQNIKPKIYPEIKTIKINNKNCVVIKFSGNKELYFAYGRAYIRVSDQNQLIEIDDIKERISAYSIWDKNTSKHKTTDTNIRLLRTIIKQGNQKGRINYKYTNPKDILSKLDLLGKRNYLLNSGYLLFSKKAKIEVQYAVFKTNEKLDFLDIGIKKGNILELIEFSKRYLFEHLNWRAILKSTRIEELEIPERALLEAIINSFCHKDYTIEKSNEIAIFPNRVEIYNPGKFPKEYTIKDYIKGKGRSILRNPLIANTLYLSDFIEKWGSGLRRINDLCKKQKIKVEYRIEPNGLSIIFYRSNYMQNDGLNASVNAPVNVPVNVPVKSHRQNETLELIFKNKNITIKDIALYLKVTTKTIKRDLIELKKDKIIKRIGSDKTGYWKIIKNEKL